MEKTFHRVAEIINRIKGANRERFAQFSERIMTILWAWILVGFWIPLAVLMFDAYVISLGYTLRLVLVIGSSLLGLTLSWAWITNRLPDWVFRLVISFGPLILVFAGLVGGFAAYMPWRMHLVNVLEALGSDYAVEVSFALCTAAVASLVVTMGGLLSYLSNPYRPDLYQPDLHSMVCQKIGSEVADVYRPIRRMELVDQRSFLIMDLRSAKNRFEIMMGITILSILVVVTFHLSDISGFAADESLRPYYLYPMIGAFMAPFIIISVVFQYRQWRGFWKTYWRFIRNMTAISKRLLDSLPRIPLTFIDSTSGVETRYEKHAKRIAANLDLTLSDHLSKPEIEWVHWYDRTKRAMKNVDEEVKNHLPHFLDVFNRLDNMPKSFDSDAFADLVRDSLALEGIEIALDWPEVFEGISPLIGRYRHGETDVKKIDIFELSVRELETMKAFPSVPLPSSVKWLLAFIGFLLAITPYILPILGAFGL